MMGLSRLVEEYAGVRHHLCRHVGSVMIADSPVRARYVYVNHLNLLVLTINRVGSVLPKGVTPINLLRIGLATFIRSRSCRRQQLYETPSAPQHRVIYMSFLGPVSSTTSPVVAGLDMTHSDLVPKPSRLTVTQDTICYLINSFARSSQENEDVPLF